MCDGRVRLKSFELKAEPFENDGEGHEQFLAGKYDTGEFSLANYCALKSRGKPYMAIPAFPNRKFRHSYIFVPGNSSLKAPAQLKGKKVGIPSGQYLRPVGARNTERRIRGESDRHSLDHAASQ